MAFTIAQRAAIAAADWLYPPRCLACDADVATAGALCADCFAQCVFIGSAGCARCGAVLGVLPPEPRLRRREAERAWDRCPDCPDRAVAFDSARAAAAHVGPARAMALALKHRDQTHLAATMGAWMARAGADLATRAPETPLVAPTPLHWHRRLTRGGDQAAALARVVARLWDAPLAEGALRRRRATRRQTTLDGGARWANVDGAFEVSADWSAALAGRRVVLVDDVLTTGATLDAAARALRAAGAVRVDALVFSRPSRSALSDAVAPSGAAAAPPVADAIGSAISIDEDA